MSHNPLHQRKLLCCNAFEPDGLAKDLEAFLVTTAMLTDITAAMIEGGHEKETEECMEVIAKTVPKFDEIRELIRSCDDKVRAMVRGLGESRASA